MDVVTALASAVGLGFLAGARLYATVLAIGLLLRFQWITLPPALQHASVLADTRVLTIAGIACAIEFVADKIPWLDSAWDSVHTFIRPIGAAVAATSLISTSDPVIQVLLFLLAGGVAFTGHSAKAATRMFVNHSPEPFTNLALSLGEDLVVAGGIWLWAKHPLVLASIALVFLVIFAILAPRIYRILRAEWTAFAALVRRWTGHPREPRLSDAQQRRTGGVPATVYSVIATGDLTGLRNAIGTLCLCGDTALFFTKRWGRAVERDLGPIAAVETRRRLLLDELTVIAGDGRRVRFDLLAGQVGRGAPSLRHERNPAV